MVIMARKLTDITDEEAITIGEFFQTELSPWTIKRGIEENYFPYKKDEYGIKILSAPYKINILEKNGEMHQGLNRKEVLLFSDGQIYEPLFSNSEKCELVKEYLLSINIESFNFIKESFKKIIYPII